MNWDVFAAAAGGFVAALVIGSFIEYAVHILMHRRYFLGKIHTQHHKDGTGDGWLREFASYAVAAVPMAAVGFAVGWRYGWEWLGAGFGIGGFAYAAFAAYAHQLQHERPELVFWMSPPVHHVHHVHKMWRHNFGIALDVWDRLLGTYQPVEWTPDPARARRSLLDFFRIKWV